MNYDYYPAEPFRIKTVETVKMNSRDEREVLIKEAGYNTFLLNSDDVYIDLLTDSGTNAMSDRQLASMMIADDAYAGSESFVRMNKAIKNVLNFNFVLPVHQGRAAEHLISKVFIKNGSIIPMNYHFTTTKVHIELNGGEVKEIFTDEALNTNSRELFKGNMDIEKLKNLITEHGSKNIPFIRMEATTNLLGGQPFSLKNLKEVRAIAQMHNIPLVLDGSLLSENAFFIKEREEEFKDWTVSEIIKEIMKQVDIFYCSARKSASGRGGFIATNNENIFKSIRTFIPVFEGFLTYGGMSCREIESIAVGLEEMVDPEVCGSSPNLIEFAVEELKKNGLPVVTPAGGLGIHIDAKKFLPHINPLEFPAGALAAALFIISGARGMERGSISMERDKDGKEVPSDMELLRLAVPRRSFTATQIEFVVDRLTWLFKNRHLIGGLKFVEEPSVLRFFFGRLQSIGNWELDLLEKFKSEFKV